MSHQPDNIFAGTQVVSLVEVRGTNNSLVHPRGAVGVGTRTPTGDQTQFLVRFPDGFEASFTREKLEVLKHFKNRLGRRVPSRDRKACRPVCQSRLATLAISWACWRTAVPAP